MTQEAKRKAKKEIYGCERGHAEDREGRRRMNHCGDSKEIQVKTERERRINDLFLMIFLFLIKKD